MDRKTLYKERAWSACGSPQENASDGICQPRPPKTFQIAAAMELKVEHRDIRGPAVLPGDRVTTLPDEEMLE